MSTLPTAIGKLTHLQVLKIQANPLRTLDFGVFRNIGNSLTDLHFSADHLNHWSSSNLGALDRLETLQVDKIPYRTLSNDSFKGLEDTLNTLVIYDSNLVSVPGAICFLTALHAVSFNYNTRLQSVVPGGTSSPCARPMPNVHTLIFNQNYLTRFDPTVFDVFINASRVIVSGNPGLYYIPTTPLMKTTFDNLIELHFDRNYFTSVPRLIEKMHNLTRLSMKNNAIRVIDGNVFDKLHQLETLELNNNPVMYIETAAFSGLTSLSTLDLTGTGLQSIPEAVIKLPALSVLSLDSTALNCTCELVHQVHWQRASNITITGQCSSGSLSLHNYIQYYLPRCK